jgi:hypothetical protein
MNEYMCTKLQVCFINDASQVHYAMDTSLHDVVKIMGIVSVWNCVCRSLCVPAVRQERGLGRFTRQPASFILPVGKAKVRLLFDSMQDMPLPKRTWQFNIQLQMNLS